MRHKDINLSKAWFFELREWGSNDFYHNGVYFDIETDFDTVNEIFTVTVRKDMAGVKGFFCGKMKDIGSDFYDIAEDFVKAVTRTIKAYI